MKIKLILVFMLTSFLLFMPVINAQELGEPWPPPEEGVEQFPAQLSFTSSGGGGGGDVAAHLEDYAGRWTDRIVGSESFWLVLWAPSPGVLGIREFYPPGSIPPAHWLIQWHVLPTSGQWRIGPFHPEYMEPEGQHAWDIRIWFGGAWHGYILRFNYYRGEVTQTTTLMAKIPTSTTLSVAKSKIDLGDSTILSVSITSGVGRPTGGMITLQQMKEDGSWISIGSGDAAAGDLSVTFEPTEPGTYHFKAVYNGYRDTSTNREYLQSESQIVRVLVGKIKTGITILVRPSEVAIDALTHKSGTISISGYMEPPIPGAKLILTIDGPTSIREYVSLAADGSFTYSFIPKKPGEYLVKASYQGDETHESQVSQTITVKVYEDLTSIYGLIATLGVAAVVIVVFYRRWKGKPIGPSPQTYCTNCKRRISRDWVSCPYCGFPLKEAIHGKGAEVELGEEPEVEIE